MNTFSALFCFVLFRFLFVFVDFKMIIARTDIGLLLFGSITVVIKKDIA